MIEDDLAAFLVRREPIFHNRWFLVVVETLHLHIIAVQA